MKVTVAELHRSFRKVRALAKRGPVHVTEPGKPGLVILSARDYAALRASQRHAFRTEDLPNHVLQRLSQARVDSRYDHLNGLMAGSAIPLGDAGAIAFDKLLSQVARIVEESGEPTSFDARTWLLEWLHSPVPAFGGKWPVDYLDTPEGFALVANTIAQMQTGSYA